MTSFPTGRCSLGDACFVPHHELRKRCPGCDGLIHLLCGRCLWEDEGEYKENSVLCPWCDPKRKNSQAPLRPGVGLKSPRRMQPSNLAPPIVEKGDQHIELDDELNNKVDDELDDKLDDELEKELDAELEEQLDAHQQQPMHSDVQQREPPMESSGGTAMRPKKRKVTNTTSRGKASARVKIKIRRRVKICRGQLFHILSTDSQRASIPKDVPNKFMFFGTVISRGKGKSSWNVKWDILPSSENVINNITRTKLIVVEDGEEERGLPADAKLDDIAVASDEDVLSPEKPAKKSAEDTFCKQPMKDIAQAELYTMRWGSGDGDKIDWTILKDGEVFSLDNDVFLPDKVEYSDDLTEEDLDDPTDFFFKFVFPDITGKFSIMMFVLSQFLFDYF